MDSAGHRESADTGAGRRRSGQDPRDQPGLPICRPSSSSSSPPRSRGAAAASRRRPASTMTPTGAPRSSWTCAPARSWRWRRRRLRRQRLDRRDLRGRLRARWWIRRPASRCSTEPSRGRWLRPRRSRWSAPPPRCGPATPVGELIAARAAIRGRPRVPQLPSPAPAAPLTLGARSSVSCDTVYYDIAHQLWRADGGSEPVPRTRPPIASARQGLRVRPAAPGSICPASRPAESHPARRRQPQWDQLHVAWCERADAGLPGGGRPRARPVPPGWPGRTAPTG